MKPPARLLAFAAAACALAGAAPAAAPARDLGLGLSYYRLHDVPADLPAPAAARGGPCVLDVRFAKSAGAGAAALRAWVQAHASARAPVFVLENEGTSHELRAALGGSAAAGLIVLAPAAEGLAADITVQVSADDDRRAYELAEKGASLDSLLADNPEKPRVDEEYLEKEHLSDADAPDAAAGRPSPPSPPTDPLLQRAVQLHRGLVALKKI